MRGLVIFQTVADELVPLVSSIRHEPVVSRLGNRFVQRSAAPRQQRVSPLNDVFSQQLHELLTSFGIQGDFAQRTSNEYVHPCSLNPHGLLEAKSATHQLPRAIQVRLR
jgi:hypothetical protein